MPVLCAEGVSAVTDREKADNFVEQFLNLSQPPFSETCSDDFIASINNNID